MSKKRDGTQRTWKGLPLYEDGTYATIDKARFDEHMQQKADMAARTERLRARAGTPETAPDEEQDDGTSDRNPADA